MQYLDAGGGLAPPRRRRPNLAQALGRGGPMVDAAAPSLDLAGKAKLGGFGGPALDRGGLSPVAAAPSPLASGPPGAPPQMPPSGFVTPPPLRPPSPIARPLNGASVHGPGRMGLGSGLIRAKRRPLPFLP